jgi:hypothetical protein
MQSWTYRDASNYGSPELALRDEQVRAIRVGADRKSIELVLTTLEQPQVEPRQTARVYHVSLAAGTLFESAAPKALEAYYTLYRFPAASR